MCCQEACLIKKTKPNTFNSKFLHSRRELWKEKLKACSSFQLCIIPNTQTHTHTNIILPHPPLFLLSFIISFTRFFNAIIILLHPFRIHPFLFLRLAKRTNRLNSCVQPSRHVRDWFSGFCPHQHSVAMVTSCQRFLLNLH